MVTDNLSEADQFFVVPCEECGNSRHFSIFYNSESKLKPPESRPKMRMKPIPSYLCTCVNFRGISDGPLELKLNAKESKSMLMLQDRRSKHLRPAELNDWINGKEIFYINCKHRSFKKDSYICVTATNPSRQGASMSSEVDTIEGEGGVSADESSKKRNTGASGGATVGAAARRKAYSYTTCCKPNISAHNDRTTFMLFRLIRVKQNVDWDKYDDPTDAADREGQSGEKGGKNKENGKKGRNTGQSATKTVPEE